MSTNSDSPITVGDSVTERGAILVIENNVLNEESGVTEYSWMNKNSYEQNLEFCWFGSVPVQGIEL